MVFLTHVDSGEIDIKRGMFLSTEMSRQLAKEINSGNLKLSAPLFPVHLPWDGLYTVDYGENNKLRIEKDRWLKAKLAAIYKGEELHNKKIVVFPMHGLGDQLYLALTLRSLTIVYPSLRVFIVRPSIKSSEQWFHYIYHDEFFSITGPVVTADEMADYDYYIDAEHFAHMEEYKGAYPPEFYMTYLFHHTADKVQHMRPELSSCPIEDERKTGIDGLLQKLRSENKPVVFVSTMTTGRVRDILTETVLDFIGIARDSFSFIISTYNNQKLEDHVAKLNLPDVVSHAGYVEGIDSLVYLISIVDYVITSDSGITHLAEALETPCGSVFNVVTPFERTKPYKFSEEMMIEFELPGVCKTPCYVHALEESQNCPGMAWQNEVENLNMYRRYAPCMENFTGEHLKLLLDSLVTKFKPSSKV